jgi:hypothetical protein
MAEARVERRLAAILAADVAGYSRLMGVDEEGTLAALKALRKELIDPKIAEHRGRIVKTTGDGVLVEFASAVDAARCATEIQRAMAERNAAIPEDRRVAFRVGINVGDIIIDEGDIYDDGVNIAARVESLASPGAVCLSEKSAGASAAMARPSRRGAIRRKLPPSPALLAESHLLGELRAGGGVTRRHHRIIRRQAPLLAVLLGRHAVLAAQMPLQRFELLAVLQAHDVVRIDRALDRHRGLERLGRARPLPARHPKQCRMHLVDQRRDVGGGDRVVADIGRHDLGGEPNEIDRCSVAAHGRARPRVWLVVALAQIWPDESQDRAEEFIRFCFGRGKNSTVLTENSPGE